MNLPTGTQNLTLDAGVIGYSTIGDRVWLDTDANGIQNAGENGVSGILVELRNCSGTILSTTATNGTGFYLFTHLPPAGYQVTFTIDGNLYFWSPANQGSDLNVNSKAVPSSTTFAS